jgi:molybdate transport system ATP-binding protein
MIDLKIKKELHGAKGVMDLELKLTIQEGSFVALHGKSGSGKTTFLRVLAGLEDAHALIKVGANIWQSETKNLAVQKREIGFVFQDYALFENMTVEENLLYVQADKALAKHLLELTELYELKERYPHSLSGGQKQRVSICRAMMKKPKILLLDEPFSALDTKIRNKLQNELLTLHKEFHTTTIMVSHDLEEIHKLASRILVLEEGKIIKDGSPQELLKTKEVLSFTL